MYTLTQEAYISDNGLTYEAHGLDENGDDLMVYWDIKVHTDDESDSCDWNHPSNIVKL